MSRPNRPLTTRIAEAASTRIMGTLSPDYAEETFRQFAQRMKVETVRRRLRARDRVLEVGCGNGLYMRVLSGLCREIVGVDITDSLLSTAQSAFQDRAIDNCLLAKGSATALPFGPDQFDLVYSFSTLVMVPDIEAAAAEMTRVLRPGGVGIFDIMNIGTPTYRHWNDWYLAQGHPGLAALSWTETQRLLSRLGMQILDQPAFGLVDHLKYWRPALNRPWLEWTSHHPSFDLDHWLSNLWPFRRLPNRWYVVARKEHDERPHLTGWTGRACTGQVQP
ncbi:hypothetical protein [Azospirillum argentinense]|uniref:class I SAM-dependent methyltransferase n=1 Tax=Azospirillum argentinense TaxID=2970906 RepID=UPI0032DF44EA